MKHDLCIGLINRCYFHSIGNHVFYIGLFLEELLGSDYVFRKCTYMTEKINIDKR